jgi:hypothetical protein
MSNPFSTFINFAKSQLGGSGGSGGSGNIDWEKLLGLGAGLAYSSGALDPVLEGLGLDFLTDSGVQPVGYQGGIPEYVAVQQQVPGAMTDTPRPGDRGQRYFTDVIYAQKPEGQEPPTLAQAQETATRRGQELALHNPVLRTMYAGGLATLPRRNFSNGGYFLGGITDGMADRVPASIDGQQEARLSDGEFVVPADVVSHLGNGNSNAGAKQLYAMMDRVRQARTGREEQGKQINPKRYMPGMGA